MKKSSIVLALILSTTAIIAQNKKADSKMNAQKNMESKKMNISEIDTLYKVYNSKEIAFFNGIEAPERTEPDFVLKEDDKEMDLKIDKTCDVKDITSCVSLYHILPSKKDQFGNEAKGEQMNKGYIWALRSSKLSKKTMEVTFGQKIGKDGFVSYSTVEVMPGELIDMGYGSAGSETKRYVWIVSASWK